MSIRAVLQRRREEEEKELLLLAKAEEQRLEENIEVVYEEYNYFEGVSVCPGYYLIIKLVAEELDYSVLLCLFPRPVSKVLAYLLAFSGIGHPFSKFARHVWYNVFWRFPVFFQISVGWWPRRFKIDEYFNFEEKFNVTDFTCYNNASFSDAFREKNFVHVLEAIVSTRAVLLQLIPGMTFVSQYAILTSGSPVAAHYLHCSIEYYLHTIYILLYYYSHNSHMLVINES